MKKVNLTTLFHLFGLSLLVGLGSLTASAQLPFYTDDADTTDKGKFHLELSNEHDLLQHELYPAKRQNTVVFTLNYGITTHLEADINSPLITIFHSRESGVENPFGIGDTQFGLKYRFHDEREGSKMPAMAAVFYVEVPSGNREKQLGSGLTDYYLYGIAQKSLTKRTKGRLNAGVVIAGNTSTGLVGIETTHGSVFTLNGSVVRDFTKKLRLGAELFGAVDNNFNSSRGQLEGQIGGNYAITQRFVLAFGVLGGHFRASPRVGAIIGFTYDFK